MKKFKTIALFTTFVLTLSLIGCGSDKSDNTSSVVIKTEVAPEKEEKASSTVTQEEKPPVVEEKKEVEVRSLLTGEIIDKKYKNKRPYAYMFNNIKFAYPQTETGKAGILYEILAEGGITRLMGVFDYMSGKRIGSARSARHYYVDFAKEFDAFFIHFGQTKYAVAEMKKLNMDTLSGLSSEGSIVFYRDHSIRAPHNAFASAEGIKKAVKQKGYRTEIDPSVTAHFNFSYDKEIVLNGKESFEAKYVTVPFSTYNTPYFTYEKGKYTRYAFGVKHIDKASNKALTFKNLFIQFVNEYNIDKNGYQTMDLIGFSGKGLYITNGKAVKVYWTKPDANAKTRFYYDEKHTKEVEVNVGKSYYAVLPTHAEQKMVFKK